MKEWSRKMQFIIGIFVALLFLALMLGAMRWRKHVIQITRAEFMELEDSYTYVIDGMEWGPEVVAVVINCGPEAQDFNESDLSAENFSVTFTSRYRNGNLPYQTETRYVDRPVASAYFCDIDGNIMDSKEGCTHLRLNFESKNYVEAFSPFYFCPEVLMNDADVSDEVDASEICAATWKELFTCSITHTKLRNNINKSNDPIYAQGAMESIKALGLGEIKKFQ